MCIERQKIELGALKCINCCSPFNPHTRKVRTPCAYNLTFDFVDLVLMSSLLTDFQKFL